MPNETGIARGRQSHGNASITDAASGKIRKKPVAIPHVRKWLTKGSAAREPSRPAFRGVHFCVSRPIVKVWILVRAHETNIGDFLHACVRRICPGAVWRIERPGRLWQPSPQ